MTKDLFCNGVRYPIVMSEEVSQEPLKFVCGTNQCDMITIYLRPITPEDLAKFHAHVRKIGGWHVASYHGLNTGYQLIPPNPTAMRPAGDIIAELCRTVRTRFKDIDSMVLAFCAGTHGQGQITSSIIVSSKVADEAYKCLGELVMKFKSQLELVPRDQQKQGAGGVGATAPKVEPYAGPYGTSPAR